MHRRAAVLVLVAVLVALVKLTNLVGVAAIAFYLLLRRDRDASDGIDEPAAAGTLRRVVTGLATGGVAVLAAAVWLVAVLFLV